MRATLVASSKGGCGKTTAAVTMAAALAERGYRVALADADPQRAGLAWLARRPDAAPRIAALDWTRPLDIGAWPESVRPNGIDWLVIDAACAYGSGAYGGGALDGGLAPLERLLERADTVVTPVGPSFFDGHAALGFLRRIENTRPVRRGQAEIVVLANRIPARRAAANALRPFLSQAALELSAAVTERAAYSRLAAQGLAVHDASDREALRLRTEWTPLLHAIGAAGRAPAAPPSERLSPEADHEAAAGSGDASATAADPSARWPRFGFSRRAIAGSA